MAPGKRAMEFVQEAGEKRQKTDAPALAAVLEVIDSVADQRCFHNGTRVVLKEMAMAGYVTRASVGAASDELHPFQVRAAEQVRQTLDWQREAFRCLVAKAVDTVTEVAQEKIDLQQNKSPADEQLRKCTTQVRDAKYALAEVTQGVLDAKTALWETEVKAKREDSDLSDINLQKDELEKCLSEHLEVVRHGRIEKTSHHLDVLMQIGEKIRLDDSLMTVLPNACTRSPEERSGFSRIAIEQFAQLVNEKIAEFQGQLEAAAPAASSRMAAREVAKGKQIDAKVALLQTAADYTSSRNAEICASNVLDDIAARLDAIDSKRVEAERARDEHHQTLERFEIGFGSFWQSEKTQEDVPMPQKVMNDKLAEHDIVTLEPLALGGQ